MISKKVREFFVSLMEARVDGEAGGVCYDPETEQYTGVFNPSVVNKFIDEGVLELVSNDGGLTIILLNNRGDFLSGFASGVSEAKLGRDQYYADYNANPFAFSVGYEHYQQLSKKKRPVPGYLCHGFVDEQTGEIHKQ
ncbi:hypothetical protein SG34_023720 [Thalassomonas viridans]|uniref:Uncharacterized protein n=1 Tax=Thalassomonas viridans TaxID=137584 RepID=A0AAF0C8L9_9GAMM|nr:hypothetical protein [Thalassomonas viridans]WDE04320.1 hypothetical protein SG34_023720 [Thalassomonas viridans]